MPEVNALDEGLQTYFVHHDLWSNDMDKPSLVERLGYGPESRLLIINCDDVGSSHSANVATFRSMVYGVASSAVPRKPLTSQTPDLPLDPNFVPLYVPRAESKNSRPLRRGKGRCGTSDEA
jgi:hypothetical protein